MFEKLIAFELFEIIKKKRQSEGRVPMSKFGLRIGSGGSGGRHSYPTIWRRAT